MTMPATGKAIPDPSAPFSTPLDRWLARLEAWCLRPWVWTSLCFLFSRLILEGVGLAGREGWEHYIDKIYKWFLDDRIWLDIWAAWDSGWYVDIVDNGYDTFELVIAEYGLPRQLNIAFFPLYPALVWCVKQLTGNTVLAGVLVSNLCFFGALRVLYQYGQERWDEAQARCAVLALAFYPNGFIFSAMYTESLFLLVFLAMALFAGRERWMWAGIMAALLSATRVPGVTVGLGLLWMMLEARQQDGGRDGGRTWRIRREDRRLLWLGLVPLGMLAYMIHLHFHSGDALGFLKIQDAFARRFQWPHEGIILAFQRGTKTDVYHAAYLLLHLGLLAVVAMRRRWGELLLALPLVLIPLTSGQEDMPLVAMPRYLLVVFPLYGAMGWLGTHRPLLFGAALACLALWQGMLMSAWATGLKFIM